MRLTGCCHRLYADTAAAEHRHRRTSYSDNESEDSDSNDSDDNSDDDNDDDDDDDDDDDGDDDGDDDDDDRGRDNFTTERAAQKSWLGKCYSTYIGLLFLLCPRRRGALSDTAIRLSVCLSQP